MERIINLMGDASRYLSKGHHFRSLSKACYMLSGFHLSTLSRDNRANLQGEKIEKYEHLVDVFHFSIGKKLHNCGDFVVYKYRDSDATKSFQRVNCFAAREEGGG